MPCLHGSRLLLVNQCELEKTKATQERPYFNKEATESIDVICRGPLWLNTGNTKANFSFADKFSAEKILQISGGHNDQWVSKRLKTEQLEPLENEKDGSSYTQERNADTVVQVELEQEWSIESLNIDERIQDKYYEAHTFVTLLKACAHQKDLQYGSKIHTHVISRGILEGNVFLGSALVNMYAKCSALEKAQDVFDKLASRNVVSWNALIGGYAKDGNGVEALKCFECMQRDSIAPNAVTFACALKACGSIGALEKGLEIHQQIVKKKLLIDNLFLANALLGMYVKCGALEKAQEVFDELQLWDAFTWTTLIAGYVHHGLVREAFNCYDMMHEKGVFPTGVTFACMLRACSIVGDIDKGQEIHGQAAEANLLEKDTVVANAVVDMYAKCGAMKMAKEVFDKISCHNVISWTALISGYVQHNQAEHALDCYKHMQLEGLHPNSFTFSCLVKACADLRIVERGQFMHAQILRFGLLKDIVVANALIDMYCKCGETAKAQQVFDELGNQDIASWTSLIVGYADNNLGDKALKCFEKMQSDGFCPDAITFACALKACRGIGAMKKGQDIHIHILQTNLLDNSTLVVNALMDMYAKCGLVDKAQEVFDGFRNWDVISWNTLLAGYVQHECYEEAANVFDRMQHEGFLPDVFTFDCVLKVCSGIGASQMGQKMHSEIVRQGLLEKDLVVGTGLVSMYANCGLLDEARDVLYKLPVRNVVSWSAFMEGYAQLGKDEFVMTTLDKMIQEGGLPDSATVAIVLNTFSHRGLLDKAQNYFETLSRLYSFTPHLEHYNCLIDLFGRAGNFDEAALVIKEMPMFTSLRMLHTLLGACKNWGNMKLGNWAFRCAIQLDGGHGGSYVGLSNIYGAFIGQEDLDNV